MKKIKYILSFLIFSFGVLILSNFININDAFSSKKNIGVNIGDKVPDITMKNQNDSIISLSSIKDKLILIDFWASWCGYCRMENPNVVAVYNKYKDEKFKKIKCKGFTIFSVSLDRDKTSWKNAIKKDGLIWPYHVSDLKYWNNAAAATYGIASIPANFLIDNKGIVLAIGLKGANLEAKLEELKNQ